MYNYNENELFKCIENSVVLSGETVEAFIASHEHIIVDWGFEDFTHRDGWSIGKYYIITVNNKYYRCWERFSLTEDLPNIYEDQAFERVALVTTIEDIWAEFVDKE